MSQEIEVRRPVISTEAANWMSNAADIPVYSIVEVTDGTRVLKTDDQEYNGEYQWEELNAHCEVCTSFWSNEQMSKLDWKIISIPIEIVSLLKGEYEWMLKRP